MGELASADFGAFESIGDRASRKGLSSVYSFSSPSELSRNNTNKSKKTI